MSALFMVLARTVLFLPFFPITFRFRLISSMVVLAPHGEVAKAFPVARLDTNKLIVSMDSIAGLELLATILADKYMVNVLPNLVLVTDITWVNPLALVLCTFVLHQLLATVKPQFRVLAGNVSSSPTMIPSSNQMSSLTNLPSTPAGPFASG